MFDTHKLTEEGMDEMRFYKKGMADAARSALALMPDSREKSIFITKLEEAVFFGAKAIAQKIGNFSELIEN